MSTDHSLEHVEVLRAIWSANEDDRARLDDCGPAHHCKNMKHVGFEELSTDGEDLVTAWHAQLARDGKLDRSGGTIRDLVLGRRDER